METRPIAISRVLRVFSDRETDRLTDRPTNRRTEWLLGLPARDQKNHILFSKKLDTLVGMVGATVPENESLA